MARFQIKDFQCIENATIEVKGLTVLHGDSSAGKSSIIKAIYAAVNNRFRPTQLRYGSDQTSIKVQWEDGGPILQVTRRLSGSPTMILKVGDSYQRYDKLNRSVPKEVEDFHKMGNLSVDNDIFSLNFFSQFQKPLLLEFPQKKVMQLMSASTAYDDYNDAKKQVEKNRDINKGSFQSLQSLQSEYSVKVESLSSYIESTQGIVSDIEKSYAAYRDLSARVAQLKVLRNLLNDLRRKEAMLEENLKVQTQCQATLKALDLRDQLLNYKNRIDVLSKVSGLQTFVESKISHLESIDQVSTRIKLLSDLSSKRGSVQDMTSRISSLQVKISSLSELQQQQEGVLRIEDVISKLKSLKSLKVSLATTNARITTITTIIEEHRCPLCGTKL